MLIFHKYTMTSSQLIVFVL